MVTSPTLRAVRRRWVARAGADADPAAVRRLASALNLPEPLCRLLVLRGHAVEDAARQFLRPRLDQLGDPFRLAGLEAAVERIERALGRGETILVHGDYDVDGICTTTLYTRVLRLLGGNVVPFVPSRLVDGYDLGEGGIQAAVEAGATLILTGDCGIVAHEAVRAAAAAGIDVVVTDHHTPGATLPDAVAVVNPNRADCAYPDKGLCGAGVAFKVCQALVAGRGMGAEVLWSFLDLVGLATVADLVPLVGENRVLARYGLKLLGQTQNPGLRALLRTSGIKDPENLSAGQVGHVLAPRINAVGRIGEASWGVQLLLAEREDEAERIAARLEEDNRSRQALDRETLAEALEMLEGSFDPERDYGVVLASERWHSGVIGIVASRVVEHVHRPTVLIALDPEGGPARGSARSIPGFHLYDALHGCADLLERFGGHKAAAGLEIRADRIERFRAAFNERCREALEPRPERLVPTIDVDLEVRVGDLTPELFRYLKHYGPFGMGNPAPVFAARDVAIAGSPRVVGENHVKLDLTDGRARLPAIGFRMADRLPELDLSRGRVDVAFQLQENHWNGRTELQAKLIDLRTAEGPAPNSVEGPAPSEVEG